MEQQVHYLVMNAQREVCDWPRAKDDSEAEIRATAEAMGLEVVKRCETFEEYERLESEIRDR